MTKEKLTGRFRILDVPFGCFTIESEVEVTKYSEPLFFKPKELSKKMRWMPMDAYFKVAYPWWNHCIFTDLNSAKLFMERAIELFNGQNNHVYSDGTHK